jgi:signal recognition particle subunit SRP54
MGDVVSLVERAAETIQVEEAEKLAAKMAKGKFDLDDLWAHLRQMQRMGGLGALANMMPGIKGMKGAMDKAQDSKALVHMEAMLSSMTARERSKPEIINAKRKIRVAKGSGTTVQDINKLMKMHQEMSTAMKRLKKMGGLGKLAAMFSKGGLEGALGGLAPPGALPSGAGVPPALPGLGGSAPFNLPQGFDKFSKK